MDVRQRRWRNGLLIGTAFVAGIIAGPTYNVLGSAFAQDGSRTEIYQLLKVFGDVLERVRAEYVEPVNDRQLIERKPRG